MNPGVPIICGHCGRPIGSFNDDDKLVYVGQTPYHYKCTQPPKNDPPVPLPSRSAYYQYFGLSQRPQYYGGGTWQ